jgi:hypothetical protein
MTGDEVEVVDQAASGAVWVFEQGGLVMLLLGVSVLMMGAAQARREGGSNRNVGFGAAMVVAASLALYLSVWMGGDPVRAAITATWMYPFVLSLSLVLVAVQMSARGRQHKARRSRSASELAELRYGRRDDAIAARSKPPPPRRRARAR